MASLPTPPYVVHLDPTHIIEVRKPTLFSNVQHTSCRALQHQQQLEEKGEIIEQ